MLFFIEKVNYGIYNTAVNDYEIPETSSIMRALSGARCTDAYGVQKGAKR